jgi:outer membrane protein
MKGLLKAVAFAGLLVATGAQAADLSAPAAGGYKDEIVADTWWNAGDIFVRVRAEAFAPNVSTSNWNNSIPVLGNLGGHPDLSAETTFVPELDLSYFLTKNIAIETICCAITTSVNATGSISSFGKVGDTWVFPPTVLLQYHFDGFGALKPYLGIGGTYVWFFDEKATHNFETLKLNSAGAVTFQAGFDYHLMGNWFLNADFKYMALGTDFSTLHGGVTGHANLDPIIAGGGIGYRFGAYTPLK